MAQQSYTLKMGPIEAPALGDRLKDRGFEMRSLDHAFWQARAPGTIISFYRSGKVLLQGKDLEYWVTFCAGDNPVFAKKKGSGKKGSDQVRFSSRNDDQGPWDEALALLPDPKPEAWIGVDEAGKGDYFGPIVIASARVERGQLGWLSELGIADSKTLTDKRIKELNSLLREAIPHHKMWVLPTRYNELYPRFRNLNRMLAWAHAACTENLLHEHPDMPAELMLSDQFAANANIPSYFKGPGKDLRFTQRTRAESDPAVACASIFARAEFLYQVARLEKQHGVRLPLGAGPPVLSAGRTIVRDKGADFLGNVAKLHFKTTKQLTS